MTISGFGVTNRRASMAPIANGRDAAMVPCADALDAPVAFLGFSPGVIEGLFVDPPHRGQGAGTLLVAHAQALAAGPLRVDVNERNVPALGFYEALGFAVVGRSATDDAGRPFPILHMRRPAPDE